MHRFLRLLALVVVLALSLILSTHAVAAPTAAARVCPGAPNPAAVVKGAGQMGVCAPRVIKLGATLTAPTFTAGQTFRDTSNNDPLSCTQIAADHRVGHRLLIVKINQGTGFVDHTARSQIACARGVGMATGGYDFVSCYCAAEARLFVSLLRANGMTRTAAGWAPPTLDVEYGSASRGGILTMESVVRQAFGRVQVYTGCWYWCGRLGGGWWPASTFGWLAGYPSAPKIPGMPRSRYVAHQFTDHGGANVSTDLSLYLNTPGGPSFATYINTRPKPVTRAQKHRRLVRLYHYRRSLRHVLGHEGCRRLHPRSPRCLIWERHGNTTNRQIKALHRERIF